MRPQSCALQVCILSTMCALQAQYDYLAGSYPVVKEDAAQMCALQIQAELGATMRGQGDQLDAFIEKYIVKQVSPHSMELCRLEFAGSAGHLVRVALHQPDSRTPGRAA